MEGLGGGGVVSVKEVPHVWNDARPGIGSVGVGCA